MLKYTTVNQDDSRANILGLSQSASLSLVRIEQALEPESARLLAWKHAKIRHSQRIIIVAPAELSTMALTVGDGSEVILWRARRIEDRTALLQALAIYKPAVAIPPTRAALSEDGNTAALVTTESTLIFRLQGRKLVQVPITLPSFPVIADIISLSFDNSNDGGLFLVAVDSSSTILVWRIDESSAELLCQAKLSSPASHAVVTPQTASSAARVAYANGDNRICLGSLILEHGRASYRDLSTLSPELTNISSICCSTTNYIACVGQSEDSSQLRIVNTQSSLFTTGLEFTMPIS